MWMTSQSPDAARSARSRWWPLRQWPPQLPLDRCSRCSPAAATEGGSRPHLGIRGCSAVGSSPGEGGVREGNGRKERRRKGGGEEEKDEESLGDSCVVAPSQLTALRLQRPPTTNCQTAPTNMHRGGSGPRIIRFAMPMAGESPSESALCSLTV